MADFKTETGLRSRLFLFPPCPYYYFPLPPLRGRALRAHHRRGPRFAVLRAAACAAIPISPLPPLRGRALRAHHRCGPRFAVLRAAACAAIPISPLPPLRGRALRAHHRCGPRFAVLRAAACAAIADFVCSRCASWYHPAHQVTPPRK